MEFLVTDAGRALLEEARTAYDPHDALALASRLQKRYAARDVAAALTQAELRGRAVTKFGADATRMFFTREGLEQATAADVATHRAARARTSGSRSVLDLCCGVGADLVAFARAGMAVTGVDQDPLTAAVATANLSALGLAGRVSVGPAEEQSRDGHDLAFADPARRSSAGRTFDPRSSSPPWPFVLELLAGRSVVKVAPGISHALVPAGVEAEWVSLDGRLKEAALWSGLADGVERRATLLRSRCDVSGVATGSATLTDADDPGPADVAPAGSFVFEPDDAVIRAHLVTAVAAELDGWLLDGHLAYISTDRRQQTPFARGYAVLDVLPFKEKQLRAALRAHDVGALTVKKRGVDVTPEILRRRLGLRGSRPATIIITRTPGSAVVLLVEPLT